MILIDGNIYKELLERNLFFMKKFHVIFIQKNVQLKFIC